MYHCFNISWKIKQYKTIKTFKLKKEQCGRLCGPPWNLSRTTIWAPLFKRVFLFISINLTCTCTIPYNRSAIRALEERTNLFCFPFIISCPHCNAFITSLMSMTNELFGLNVFKNVVHAFIWSLTEIKKSQKITSNLILKKKCYKKCIKSGSYSAHK